MCVCVYMQVYVCTCACGVCGACGVGVWWDCGWVCGGSVVCIVCVYVWFVGRGMDVHAVRVGEMELGNLNVLVNNYYKI